MDTVLLKKDDILRKIEESRKRSTIQRFFENPLKAIEENPSVFYFLTIIAAMGMAIFLLYSGVRATQVVIFSLLLAIMPAGFYDYYKKMKVKVMEVEFPSLLRDIALAAKSGMPLESAVKLTATGNYGKLTPAVKHVDYMVSWGISFEEALLHLANHYPAPLIKRSVSTIIEAARTGGEIGTIMENVATDAQELKALEGKRGAETQPYLMVVYISYFVFLMVVLVIAQFFIPQMQEVSKQIEGTDTPGLSFRVTEDEVKLYKEIFFHGLLMQGFFAGMVAGKISGGTILGGLKHSAVFVAIAVVTYVVAF